ncbi:MAG: hypothetical protein QNJ32_26310 [Xenococcaceae cyanobacterium MO_167.B27]|nr:hypothetical protein [Xenococcaceae cyanobacterium MO_167.B27]
MRIKSVLAYAFVDKDNISRKKYNFGEPIMKIIYRICIDGVLVCVALSNLGVLLSLFRAEI